MSVSVSPLSAEPALRSPEQEISLVLITDSCCEFVSVLPEETIRDLKLRLKHNHVWWSSRHCLVFGDRELLDHQRVKELVNCNPDSNNGVPGHVHVFVKLNDIEAVAVRTLAQQFQWDASAQDEQPVYASSALTQAMRQAPPAAADAARSDCALVRKDCVPQDTGSRVVHLIVRRSARLSFTHSSGDQFELSISGSDTADSVKRRLEAEHGSLPAEGHQLLYGGEVLESNRPLASYGIGKGDLLELRPLESIGSTGSAASNTPPLSSPSHELHENWQKARAGLAEGVSPVLAKEGTGGSYFLQDVEGRSVAVFKPEDEEPLAVNNPKGLAVSPTGEGLRKGTRPGEGAVREVAAYVLDHGHFSGVPPTALVSCDLVEDGSGSLDSPGARNGAGSFDVDKKFDSFRSHDSAGSSGSSNALTRRSSSERKTGSLQQFVVADGDCEERGPSAFPVHQVHKICVLDIRLANTDRNGGNILARRGADGEFELIPIDHGYTLPATLEDISFEWMWWPQARQPFSPATLDYISALDAESDIALLASHGLHLRDDCLRTLRVCTLLLKKAAAAGLTAYHIAYIMTRQSVHKSPLEKLSHAATQRARAEQYGDVLAGSAAVRGGAVQLPVDDDCYLRHMDDLIDEYLADFATEEEALLADGGDVLL